MEIYEFLRQCLTFFIVILYFALFPLGCFFLYLSRFATLRILLPVYLFVKSINWGNALNLGSGKEFELTTAPPEISILISDESTGLQEKWNFFAGMMLLFTGIVTIVIWVVLFFVFIKHSMRVRARNRGDNIV